MKIGYINIFVSNISAAVSFYRDTLGLVLERDEGQFGYASFNATTVHLGMAETEDTALIGRHTGIGFIVDDIDAKYIELLDKGVEFEMPPTKQPWGGTLALFKDPDGNVFYLDPGEN